MNLSKYDGKVFRVILPSPGRQFITTASYQPADGETDAALLLPFDRPHSENAIWVDEKRFDGLILDDPREIGRLVIDLRK